MIPEYFKNSLLKFKTQEYYDEKGVTQKDGKSVTLIVPDYKSIDFNKVYKLLSMCPESWFQWVKLQNHTNLEKLAFDLYGSANYWDILLIINGRMPLFEFPYDYDVIELIVDNMTDEYIKRTYKKEVSDKVRERIRLMFSDKVAEDNERYRYIKVINKAHLYDFIRLGYEYEIFSND